MLQVADNPAVVADQLEALNALANDGRGSSVCRAVIAELRDNDVQGAITVASLDFDKVRQYPELAQKFEQVGLLSGRSLL